jgi:hypothetical protein
LKLHPLKRNLPLTCALALAGGLLCRAQDAGSAAAAAPAVSEPKPAGETAGPKPAADMANAQKPFFKRWFSLEALGATVPGALLQQVHDWPDEWGKKRLGFEKRVGSLYGQFAVGVLIEDGVKAIHAEDTRYRRLGKGNFFKRTGYVVAGTVTARRPDGARTMASSLPANAYGSWAIATLWSPREYRTASSILEWGTAGVGVTAGTNLVKEFWPDLKSIFHKKR